jgi:hypothetical protein
MHFRTTHHLVAADAKLAVGKLLPVERGHPAIAVVDDYKVVAGAVHFNKWLEHGYPKNLKRNELYRVTRRLSQKFHISQYSHFSGIFV